MTLINTVTYDMSPLVRKELVVALQWMVLHFENLFVTLAIAEDNRGKDLVVETFSPFSGMRRINSKDRLKSVFSPNSASIDTPDGFNQDRIKRVSSVSSISSLGKKFVKFFYLFLSNSKIFFYSFSITTNIEFKSSIINTKIVSSRFFL